MTTRRVADERGRKNNKKKTINYTMRAVVALPTCSQEEKKNKFGHVLRRFNIVRMRTRSR